MRGTVQYIPAEAVNEDGENALRIKGTEGVSNLTSPLIRRFTHLFGYSQ